MCLHDARNVAWDCGDLMCACTLSVCIMHFIHIFIQQSRHFVLEKLSAYVRVCIPFRMCVCMRAIVHSAFAEAIQHICIYIYIYIYAYIFIAYICICVYRLYTYIDTYTLTLSHTNGGLTVLEELILDESRAGDKHSFDH